MIFWFRAINARYVYLYKILNNPDNQPNTNGCKINDLSNE